MDSIYTSAMATARFLQSQDPDGTACAISESGLTAALHDVGYTLTGVNPEYVVLGETTSYSFFERISQATQLVADWTQPS
jgi:5'-nucleotidase